MARRLSRRLLSTYVADQLQAGVSAHDVMLQLAAYLLQNRRLNEHTLIVRDVEMELARRGQQVGSLHSAFPLSDQTKAAITDLITRELDAKSVSLDEFIDPSLVGGYRVDLPGHQIDQTIKTQLTTLKTQFRKA